MTNTGTSTEQNPPSPFSQEGTGSMNTGSIDSNTGMLDNTGITNTGIAEDTNNQIIEQSNTGILFPQIIPTRQEPTNAVFS
jgi:hypothetical protein